MEQIKESQNPMRVSDSAVLARTGKSWTEWFAILDEARAKRMSHKQIVTYLHEKHVLEPWWRQMVTVSYEQERGLREKYQKSNGYAISRSKTINVSIADLYQAWREEKRRGKWLPDSLVIRKSTKGKSIRIDWTDPESRLDVDFYPKGNVKSQVTVQQSKLADAKTAAKMKGYWTRALNRLKEDLEGPASGFNPKSKPPFEGKAPKASLKETTSKPAAAHALREWADGRIG